MTCRGCLGHEEWGPEGPPPEEDPPEEELSEEDLSAAALRPQRAALPPVRPAIGWRPLAHPAAQARLADVLQGWRGTPYQDNTRVRGVGVDCRHLVAAVLDEWSGRAEPTPLPPASRDSGVHDGRAGFRTALAIRRVYRSALVRRGPLEPGDILVVRAERRPTAERRLGHTLIVGTRPHTTLHATPQQGVCQGGLGSIGEILRVYRPLDKALWT